MRIKLFILFILILGFLAAEETTRPDTSKSFLFRMFKLKKEQGVEYEKGYFWDRVFRRREFHEPVKFIPIELRYGFGYNGGQGFLGLKTPSSWMTYETESATSFTGGSFTSHIGHQLDMDIAKTNLAYYLLKTSWLDMHSGLNLRYASLFLPAEIPTEWNTENSNWIAGAKFTGKVFELSWSQSLMLQWYESWFINMRYTYGQAFSKFYSLESPTGRGPSQSFALGGRIILDPGQNNRYAVGVDLKGTRTIINNISDKKDVSPIKSFTLENMGVFATFSVFFGGRKTEGDTGKMHYYRRDYISATRLLESFVKNNPNHANLHRAKLFIEKSKPKIPLQLMKEGMSFDERGMTKQALARYRRARVLADSTLIPVLDERIKEMAYTQLENAESILRAGRGEEAIKMAEEISGWFPDVETHVLRFETTHLIQEGKKAMDFGFFGKALGLFKKALEKDPGFAFEVGTYRFQIASNLLAMADSARDLRDVRFAVYALEEAKELTGGLNRENSKILVELKEKLAKREEILLNQKIAQRMKIEREKVEEKPAPIKVGMTIPQVQNIMGEPSEIVAKGPDQTLQLWIYRYVDGTEVSLSFSDYILFRIDRD